MWMRQEAKSAPPSGYGMGYGGGPLFADAYRSRRAPSPWDLVEQFNSILFACCWINAHAVSRVPLRLYAVTKEGKPKPKWWNYPKQIKRTTKARLKSLPYLSKALAGAEELDEITSHPLLDLIHWVSEDMDENQLMQYTCICLDLFGYGYWWPFMGKLGIPEEIWALPAQHVQPEMVGGLMAPERYRFGGTSFDKRDLLKFKRIAPRNPYGLGMGGGQASIEYTRLESVFTSLQDSMLSNGPRPSILVSHRDPKGAFGDAERRRLEMEMNTRGRGGKAGGVFVVDGAATLETLSYSPTDLGGLEIADYNLERTCNTLDVPPTFFSKDTNLANLQTATEHHGHNAVEPRCKNIATTLTRWIHSLDGRGTKGWDRLAFAFDPAVAEDRKAEADNNKAYVDMGVFTRNEVRLELGYEPMDGGDVLLVPNSLATLDSIINPPEPVAAPGAFGIDEEDPEAADEEDPEAEADDESDTPSDKALRTRVKALSRLLERAIVK